MIGGFKVDVLKPPEKDLLYFLSNSLGMRWVIHEDLFCILKERGAIRFRDSATYGNIFEEYHWVGWLLL